MVMTRTITESYEAQSDDYYLGVDSEKPITITLPAEPENGMMIIVKAEMKPPLGNRIITIKSDETIDNYISRTIQVSNEVVRLVYNNGWRVI
jgi:hypothetical protein